ncbi:hypothetical protein TRV_00708 [Trichophyton verrucosum HKI 0517]|uniref:Uncharacterized protein n=1 Tax=Trichophyton verrucosum (strain HKI 0517) TaxID=663202 RepID=D4D0W2_TRIVH|nr:uncharacterized protein TRV_00708 [Trichophyton verrucosum HKI 0517]EFE44518.1 hypothetical protein TRV_00708 [Trichophyton verrucosum HKI 0517]
MAVLLKRYRAGPKLAPRQSLETDRREEQEAEERDAQEGGQRKEEEEEERQKPEGRAGWNQGMQVSLAR